MTMQIEAAHALAEQLKARAETVAVAESSAGGLIAASLLAVPGASAYFNGGAVIYTLRARRELLGLDRATLERQEPLSESYVALCAERIGTRLRATWGLAELGATGPAGTPYGHDPGIAVLAVSGPVTRTRLIETGHGDRAQNMLHFCAAALELLGEALNAAKTSAS